MGQNFERNAGLTIPVEVQRRLYMGVLDLFGVGQETLQSGTRERDVTLARQAIVLALRHYDPKLSWRQLATAIYREDHTTAIHADRAGARAFRANPYFRNQVEHLRARVGKKDIAPPPAGADPADYWRERYKEAQLRIEQLETAVKAIHDMTYEARDITLPLITELERGRAQGEPAGE